jgi:hypothetical protein
MRERSYLGDLDKDGRIILKRIFKKQHESVNWIDMLRIGTSDALL